MIPIVDTHQHLWDLTQFQLAWFDPKTPEGKILGHNFTPKEYAEATKGLNLVKAVYMEVDVVPEQQQKEADYVVELCKSGTTPTCAAVVSGRPNSDAFEAYAKQFKGSKYVKGIRQVLHVKSTPPGYALEPAFVKGIKLLGDLGLSFDLCVRPAELPDYVKLVDQCPGTRFVLDHCGKPAIRDGALEPWATNLAHLASHDTVSCKLSGLLTEASPSHRDTATLMRFAERVVECFGPDRLMYGSDWPVLTLAGDYANWYAFTRHVTAQWSADELAGFYGGNAARFYGFVTAERLPTGRVEAQSRV